MARIISVHSFRGGTGKSNTSANLGSLMGQAGKRVGIVDSDIQSPGIHVLFGLAPEQVGHSLNDYLWGKCDIEAAAHDVSAAAGVDRPGRLYLIPSSIEPGEIARVLREGYDVGLLNDGFQRLLGELALDVLLIDTHPGVGEETLLSIAISDALLIVMRPDQQDYQGTGVTVEIGKKLNVPNMMLLVNKTPEAFDMEEVRVRVERTFGAPVAAVVPHSDEMMALASRGVFVREHPDHEIAGIYRSVVERILG